MIIFLLIIFCLIVIANVTPNTYLSIWDSIHSEFNYALDIKRNIFAVWQEYRGLGLLDGMAHAADLPRQLLLLLLSPLLPAWAVRYTYHFLMLAVGTLGIYYLMRKIIQPAREKNANEAASVLSALFYLLNFGTIQYFSFPFEAFSTFWGMFPWLIYVFIKTLKNPTKSNLLILALVNLLSSPAFYIQTIFIIYILCILGIMLAQGRSKSILLGLKLLIIIFLVNSFWLLPSVYFFRTSRQTPILGKMNQMVTENTYLYNKARGKLEDFILLRGYYYDFVEESGYLLHSWREHFNSSPVVIWGYVTFAIILLGLIRPHPYRNAIAAIFALSAIALLSATYPVSTIQDTLRQSFPLWDQIFRSPFSKFVVLAAFSFALLFGLGSGLLLDRLQSELRKKTLAPRLVVLTACLFFAATLFPVFEGEFISPKARLNIPAEYFDLFSYLNNAPTGRVATFPQPSFWGWTSYDFGFRGSGFIWQGIKHPVLDRAFDVWSRQSENYYWEISQAVASQNQGAFEGVLRKYHVAWLILDDHVIGFPGSEKADNRMVEYLIANSKIITPVKVFGKIRLYRVNTTPVGSFVYASSNLPRVASTYLWGERDAAFKEYGDYVSSPSSQFATRNSQFVYYPFRSLFTGKTLKELAVAISASEDTISLITTIPRSSAGGLLRLSSSENTLPQLLLDGEIIILSEVERILPIRQERSEVALPYVREGKLEVRIPRYQSNSFDSRLQQSLYRQKAKHCDIVHQQTVTNTPSLGSQPKVRLLAKSATNCLSITIPNLNHNLGYLISVEAQNLAGKPLLFWLENPGFGKTNLETYLQKMSNVNTTYFIQPPLAAGGKGYVLHFWNTAIGAEESINDLGVVRVDPIPYELLSTLKIVKGGEVLPALLPPTTDGLVTDHPNESVYFVSYQQPIANSQQLTLILSQAYDEGWKAYELECQMSNVKCQMAKAFPFIFGEELKEHVLVNNWSNGWILQSSIFNLQSSIVLVYLPQYLEYLGFALSLGTIAFLAIKSIGYKDTGSDPI